MFPKMSGICSKNGLKVIVCTSYLLGLIHEALYVVSLAIAAAKNFSFIAPNILPLPHIARSNRRMRECTCS